MLKVQALKFRLLILVIILIIGPNTYFNAQTNAKPASTKKTGASDSAKSIAADDFFGTVDKNNYNNKFFKIKITSPADWLVQEREIGDAIKDRGMQAMTGKSKQVQKSFDEAANRVSVFFTVSRDIMGIPNNAVLIFASEKIVPPLQIRNGKDYLRINIQTFKQMTLPADLKYSEIIESEQFGNETLYYLQITRALSLQRIYAFYRNGYALFFTLQYSSDKDLDELRQIIATTDFEWKGR